MDNLTEKKWKTKELETVGKNHYWGDSVSGFALGILLAEYLL